jgi:hypothetical protein
MGCPKLNDNRSRCEEPTVKQFFAVAGDVIVLNPSLPEFPAAKMAKKSFESLVYKNFDYLIFP